MRVLKTISAFSAHLKMRAASYKSAVSKGLFPRGARVIQPVKDS